jgi:hypothetical protein
LLRGDILKCGSCRYALDYVRNADPVFACYHTLADPAADCHKMKVNVRELDETVLTIIRKQTEVVLQSDNIDNLRRKNDDAHRASDSEKLIAEFIKRRQLLYERFILHEIDRAEYLKLKDECSAEIDRLTKQVAAAKAEARSKDNAPALPELSKRTAGETIPYKELINTLIDKVYVFPNKHIEIVWKITDVVNLNIK